jgi:RecB family endonuclease NucS
MPSKRFVNRLDAATKERNLSNPTLEEAATIIEKTFTQKTNAHSRRQCHVNYVAEQNLPLNLANAC